MTQQKVPVIDLSPQEFAAFSAIEGSQAEQRFESRRHAANRRLRAGPGANRQPADAGGSSGVHSRPSGSAPDMKDVALAVALLIPAAIVLGVTLGGYLGIHAVRAGWEYLTRRKA